MSVNMLHSIAFAKWFIAKHRQSLTSNDDLLSLLDQYAWDEFLTSEHATLAKSTADVLISQLVNVNQTNTDPTNPPNPHKPHKPHKPRNPRKPKTIANTFRSDASTSTLDDSYATSEIQANTIHAFAPIDDISPIADEINNKPQKRVRKTGNKMNHIAPDNTDATVPEIVNKQPKKRTGKGGKITLNNIAADNLHEPDTLAPVTQTDTDAPIVTQTDTDAPIVPQTNTDAPIPQTDTDAPIPQTNTDAPIPQTNTDADAPVPQTNTDAPVQEIVKKEPKKRGGKNGKQINNIATDATTDAPVQEIAKKEPKKRGDKNGKKMNNIAADAIDTTDAPVQEIAKKEPKKRGGKKMNNIATDAPDAPVQEIAKKEPKKRGGKKMNNIATDATDATTDAPVQEIVKKEPKKRGPKSKKLNIDQASKDNIHTLGLDHSVEVVIPTQEQLQFSLIDDNHELTEDPFDDDQLELTEHFINDILFYVSTDRRWFDANLSPINSPV